MEYIAPTLAFLLGVLIYKESFDSSTVGFMIVWSALILFVIEGFLAQRTVLAKLIPAWRKG
jgi:chloramphenicol-sensitive protein RarD